MTPSINMLKKPFEEVNLESTDVDLSSTQPWTMKNLPKKSEL